MKYRANSQDTWHKIKVKALDGMPVGSIVDYDGQVSDIPSGWEQYDDGVVLFESSDPNGQLGNITLNDSVANYSKIEVSWRDNDGFVAPSMTFINCNGRAILLYEIYDVYIKYKALDVNNNTLTIFNNGQATGEIAIGGSITRTDAFIKVTKVVGYK